MTHRGSDLRQGELLTLFASAARTVTASTNGTAVEVDGERLFYVFLLEYTDKATDNVDLCDVYVDTLIGATWVNAIHFTQVLGDAANASSEVAILDVSTPGGATVVVTGDAASGAIRQGMVGSQFRGRYTIVDVDADGTFTFSLKAYAL